MSRFTIRSTRWGCSSPRRKAVEPPQSWPTTRTESRPSHRAARARDSRRSASRSSRPERPSIPNRAGQEQGRDASVRVVESGTASTTSAAATRGGGGAAGNPDAATWIHVVNVHETVRHTGHRGHVCQDGRRAAVGGCGGGPTSVSAHALTGTPAQARRTHAHDLSARLVEGAGAVVGQNPGAPMCRPGRGSRWRQADYRDATRDRQPPPTARRTAGRLTIDDHYPDSGRASPTGSPLSSTITRSDRLGWSVGG